MQSSCMGLGGRGGCFFPKRLPSSCLSLLPTIAQISIPPNPCSPPGPPAFVHALTPLLSFFHIYNFYWACFHLLLGDVTVKLSLSFEEVLIPCRKMREWGSRFVLLSFAPWGPKFKPLLLLCQTMRKHVWSDFGFSRDGFSRACDSVSYNGLASEHWVTELCEWEGGCWREVLFWCRSMNCRRSESIGEKVQVLPCAREWVSIDGWSSADRWRCCWRDVSLSGITRRRSNVGISGLFGVDAIQFLFLLISKKGTGHN